MIEPPPDSPKEAAADGREKPKHWPPQTPRQAALALYFMRRSGAKPGIKIGVSVDPIARLRQIKSQIGNESAELLFVTQQTIDDNERTLHRRLQQYRMGGEWFALTDAVLREVDRMRRHALPVAPPVVPPVGDKSSTPVRYPLNPSSLNPSSLNPSSLNPSPPRASARGSAADSKDLPRGKEPAWRTAERERIAAVAPAAVTGDIGAVFDPIDERREG